MAKATPFHDRRTAAEDPALGMDRSAIPIVMEAPPVVYHDDDACPEGQQIPVESRALGDASHERCPICARLGVTNWIALPGR